MATLTQEIEQVARISPSLKDRMIVVDKGRPHISSEPVLTSQRVEKFIFSRDSEGWVPHAYDVSALFFWITDFPEGGPVEYHVAEGVRENIRDSFWYPVMQTIAKMDTTSNVLVKLYASYELALISTEVTYHKDVSAGYLWATSYEVHDPTDGMCKGLLWTEKYEVSDTWS